MTPTPSAPAVTVLDEDVLLVVSATATTGGSAIELTMQVHRALAWDDPAAASLAALMTKGCDGSLEESVYADGLWSFVSIDINATPAADESVWPAGKPIGIYPTHSDELALASEGAIVEEDSVDIATPHCVRDRHLEGPGESTLVVGIAGDTDATGAAGQFTRWANFRYGYFADSGVVLSDCEFLLTDAGKELNGGAEWWSQAATENDCVIGSLG